MQPAACRTIMAAPKATGANSNVSRVVHAEIESIATVTQEVSRRISRFRRSYWIWQKLDKPSGSAGDEDVSEGVCLSRKALLPTESV